MLCANVRFAYRLFLSLGRQLSVPEGELPPEFLKGLLIGRSK